LFIIIIGDLIPNIIIYYYLCVIYTVCLEGEARSLYCAAQNEETAKEWIQSLRSCINVENYFADCAAVQSDTPIPAVVKALSDVGVKTLVIQNFTMTKYAMLALCEMLRRNKLFSKLVLHDCGLTDSFMEILGPALAQNEGM